MIIDAPVITVDGPSGAGKGTLCKAISESLKWHFLDSGIFYRVLALVAIHDKLDIISEDVLMSIASYLDIRFFIKNNEIQVILSGKNVTNQIRTQEVDNMASYVATFPRVRKALLHQQRMFRKKPGLIADGRDVGTIVFPDATIKIFLDATLTARAYRRMLQLQENGFNVNLNQILTEIKERDYRDSNRSTAPLIPASDALVLNSTSMSSEQVVKKALDYIHQKLKI